jgi:hypothetical protein
MISEINQELTDIEDDHTNTNLQVTHAITEYVEVDRKIETQNKIKALLENLLTLTDDLVGHTKKMQDILDQYSARSIEDFLSLAGFSSVEDIISEATRLELHIEHIENDIQTTQKQICTENE